MCTSELIGVCRLQSVVSCWWAFGQSVSHLVSPWVMENQGWEWTYIYFGGFVLMFCYCWHKFAHNTPEDDPNCCEAERRLCRHEKVEGEAEQKFDLKVYLAIIVQRPVMWFVEF